MSPPTFSVVTCCYNQGQFLPDCFAAVAAQRYPQVEHIVVDDGSTDDTRAICARYPHVRYIHQANAGQSAALNRGFAEATGDIIAWVNSDDYFAPGAFRRVARELDPARGRWIVAGAAQVVDAAGGFQWLLPNGPVPWLRLLFHPELYRRQGHTAMPTSGDTQNSSGGQVEPLIRRIHRSSTRSFNSRPNTAPACCHTGKKRNRWRKRRVR